jgi:tetratricopeptide (TPR) repeat protein
LSKRQRSPSISTMSWPDSIDLDAISPTAFRKRLERHFAKSIAPNELIALYNRVVDLARRKPSVAGSLADAAVSLFKRRHEPNHQSLFLELSARTWMQAGELTRAIEAVYAFLAIACTERHFRDLVELTDDLCGATLCSDWPNELAPKMLAVATAVYEKTNQPEKQVNAYLSAVALFARYGAIQAAYRAASEAEVIARRVNSFQLLAHVLQQVAIVAYEEQDFEWSVNAGREALNVYSAQGLPAPVALRSNTATAMMNTGTHKEALENLEAILPTLTAEDQLVRFQIYVNMAACRRQLSDLAGARAVLVLARASATPDYPPKPVLNLNSLRLALWPRRPTSQPYCRLSAAQLHV